MEDLRGVRFFSLVAIKDVGTSNRGRLWECQCDCGGKKVVSAGKLKEMAVRSCGCRRYKGTVTHRMSESRMYRIWCTMKSRCNNPKAASYENYGGRGIRVCERWENSFENFYEDMIEGYADHLLIDRKDNDAHYCKENCRWSTRAEQARNKRNNFWYERDGIRMIKMDWAAHLGISHNHFNSMLRQGYSFDQIFDFYKDRKRWKIKDQLNDNRKNKLPRGICNGGVCE